MKARILETADRLFYLQASAPSASIPSPPRSASASARSTTTFPKNELIAAYLAGRFNRCRRPTSRRSNRFSEPSIGWSGVSRPRVSRLPVRQRRADSVPRPVGQEDAIAFKESRRIWFRDLLMQLEVADANGLATQLQLLVDGAIATDLVRNDPSAARAAKDAARVLLRNAGLR